MQAMQIETFPFYSILSSERRSVKKLTASEYASAYEALSEKLDENDPVSDSQSVVYYSGKIDSPKQDKDLDEHVEGSNKPINFSALKDQRIEFKKKFFLKMKKDSERRKRAKIKMVDFDHDQFKSKILF